ncbi:MAG: NADPH-dependent F420 reductase [Deltaproteobacteria bacterium]|nr:NADPH-dependent F420 reductase [Deltaproteobacteria bacterium]
MTTLATLAFIGGTGKLGRGLGLRLAAAGHPVLIGSRSEERAVDAAATLRAQLGVAGCSVTRLEGRHNAATLPQADVVFLSLPFAMMDAFLAEHGTRLDGKIVVDVMNPLRLTDGRFEVAPVLDGSAGMRARRLVPAARVVSAFKNAAASHLLRLDRSVDGDILLAADDADAKAVVADLVRAIPVLRPVDAGPLANGAFLEAITALELNLNRMHKRTTSIRILGLE